MNRLRTLASRCGTCLVAVSLTTGSAVAMAEADTASRSGLQMAAVADRAKGRVVLAGRYGEAISDLGDRSGRRFEARTNLCVAYTMTGELDKADAQCNAALALSRKDDVHRDIAVALSNRGVLKAIRGDLSGARDDFRRALDFERDLRQATENLDLLTRSGAAEA